MTRWTLPEFVEDILPPDALRMEALRRRLLDLLHVHGYLLVQPPLLEHLESLLTGTGHDLELETFKVVDQLSGRLLGLRADMTPQVARMDAHQLHKRGVVRLCYAGSVLRTKPAGLHQTREVLQLGAELYGYPGTAADLEVIELMLAALECAGVSRAHLDLSHIGVVRGLNQAAGLDTATAEAIVAALQSKDAPTLGALTANFAEPWKAAFRALPKLYGAAHDVLGRARSQLPLLPALAEALGQLEMLVNGLGGTCQSLQLDLADVRGYHYHTGVMFAAYTPGEPNAVGRGGRYDNIGAGFGQARPATGFSLDLRQLERLQPFVPEPKAVMAPAIADPALQARIQALRAAGTIVVVPLPGEAAPSSEHVSHHLACRDGEWLAEPL